MKILVLAQNPKTTKHIQEPLKGTKSWTILQSWLEAAEVPESILELRNAVDTVAASTAVPTLVKSKLSSGGWVPEILGYPVIVCLGTLAKQAIIETRQIYFPNTTEWDHFFLPHPSGLNRALNDPEAHYDAIEQLRKAHARVLALRGLAP